MGAVTWPSIWFREGLQCSRRVDVVLCFVFFFQAEDGIRDYKVTGVQTCALPILGVNIESGLAIEHGHEHHMRAINRVRSAGGLRQMVERGELRSGVMKSAIEHDVEIVLAGSVRDDGPLPDVITEMVEAQRQMRIPLWWRRNPPVPSA